VTGYGEEKLQQSHGSGIDGHGKNKICFARTGASSAFSDVEPGSERDGQHDKSDQTKFRLTGYPDRDGVQ
jgi:hypothetical protein